MSNFDPIADVKLVKLLQRMEVAVQGIEAARDNVKADAGTNRDNIKTHVSATVAGIPAGAAQSVNNVVGAKTGVVVGDDGSGSRAYFDVAVPAVDMNKSFVLPIAYYISVAGVYCFVGYRLISNSVVRVSLYASSAMGAGVTSNYAFSVVAMK